MSESSDAGQTRREILKRSVVVGGLVWVAPTVLASPAGATTVPCDPAHRYAVKHEVGKAGCSTPGTKASTGSCAPSAGITVFEKGCCVENGLVTFTESQGGTTHTYVLAAGVGFVQGFGKCAGVCFRHGQPEAVVTKEDDLATGKTTITISCPKLSHSELIVCLNGSNLPACP